MIHEGLNICCILEHLFQNAMMYFPIDGLPLLYKKCHFDGLIYPCIKQSLVPSLILPTLSKA